MKNHTAVACAVLAGLFVIGLATQSRNAGKRQKQSLAKAPASAGKQAKDNPVFEHGFKVGYGMAKTGMIKPKSDELDAMARQAALQMNNKGGTGFKMVWKNGFSMGWMQGD